MACGGAGAGSSGTTGDEQDQTGSSKLLDCNVFLSGGGPDQQVTVLRKNGGLVLRELTENGATEERPLSEEEWSKKDIELRDDEYGSKNRFWKASDGWMYESKSDGWRSSGYADCSRD